MNFLISSDRSRGCAIFFFRNSVFRKERKLYIYKYNKIDININVKSLMYLFKKEKKVLLCRQKRTIMAWDSIQEYGHKSSPKKKSTGKTVTLKPTKPGQKPISFKEGGLHKSTNTPPGEKISAAKHKAAGEGKYGPLAKKQEDLYRNVLKG